VSQRAFGLENNDYKNVVKNVKLTKVSLRKRGARRMEDNPTLNREHIDRIRSEGAMAAQLVHRFLT
jgi:hypothetical protein